MTRGSRWVVAGAALGTVLLAGCDSSGGDQPSPSPTPSASSVSPSASPSSSPTPTPSESGPQIPAAAREQTPAGAEAYVEYFFDQFNVAYKGPKPGVIEALGTHDCEFCAKSEARAVALASEGQRYAGDAVTVDGVSSFGGAPEGQQYVRIEFTQLAATVVDEDGKQVDKVTKGSAVGNAAVVWREGRWFVRGVEKG